MTHGEGPLPDVRQTLLDEQRLRELFADLQQHVVLHSVLLRQGAGSVEPKSGENLATALEALLARRVRGAQIRYEYEGSLWIDTFSCASASGEVMLTRIKHEPMETDLDRR